MVNYLRKIKEGKYTLIVRRDNQVIFKSSDSGLKSLVFASKKNLLKKAVVYDKVIGLAAAKIAVYSGARKLHALLASKLAVTFCQKKKVPLKAEKIVERIDDSQNQNGCCLEKMAQEIGNLSDLIKHFDSLS